MYLATAVSQDTSGSNMNKESRIGAVLADRQLETVINDVRASARLFLSIKYPPTRKIDRHVYYTNGRQLFCLGYGQLHHKPV